MSVDRNSLGVLHPDPLYLSALASIGTDIVEELRVVPSGASIAVLPFVNLSGDVEQELFTDGLTEDIITDLSNIPGFFVIARNSTFAYKGRSVDVRQIARDLGVRYVLEGSVRRHGQKLRVNVQLIDATGGGVHLFAERFDRELSDIFVLQDDISHRVVETITGRLASHPPAERHRPTNLEAYELCVRARNLTAESKAAADESRALLERAIAIDPDLGEAHWRLAIYHFDNWSQWAESEVENRAKAVSLARRAVEIDGKSSGAHWALGLILSYEGLWDEAEKEFATALHLNPNDADAIAQKSDLLVLVGRPSEAIEYAARALRLNPRPPGWYYWLLGQAQVANGQYDLAISTLRREETYRTASRRVLAAALALAGRVSEAQEEARFFMATSPSWRITDWHKFKAFRDPRDLQTWIKAFRVAGLPE